MLECWKIESHEVVEIIEANQYYKIELIIIK